MSQSLTYQDAGVDIDAGNELVANIKNHVAKTHRKGVLSPIGGFGGLFELPTQNYKQPVMVSCTDGVGTKLMLAIKLNKHDTIGIDCVAMCVNDCICSGAEPLWFLDYFACDKLSVEQAQGVIQGIAQGCEETNVALIGGETAEMPGMYKPGDYDVAGFCVGIVEKSKILDGKDVKAGDVLIGMPSSGVHSNGFSLVRKILEMSNTPLDMPFGDSTIGDTLLTPTRLYVNQTLGLTKDDLIKACAHITGGGLLENIPRSIPDHLSATVDLNTWQLPEIFSFLQAKGNISHTEMLRTFNCGVGMVFVVAQEKAEQVLSQLASMGEPAFKIGNLAPRKNESIIFKGKLA